MLDNLRDDSAGYMFEEDDADFLFPEEEVSEVPKRTKRISFRLGANGEGRFLGMTAPQRLIIAIMLMFAVCSLGAMCLLITGKFALY
jgi:hypothetical protein